MASTVAVAGSTTVTVPSARLPTNARPAWTATSWGSAPIVFAYALPTLRSIYVEPLRFGEGATLYLALPWPPAVTGVLVTTLGILAYAFVRGRSSLPDDPGKGEATTPGTRAQATLPTRSLSAVAVGLREVAPATPERYALSRSSLHTHHVRPR